MANRIRGSINRESEAGDFIATLDRLKTASATARGILTRAEAGGFCAFSSLLQLLRYRPEQPAASPELR